MPTTKLSAGLMDGGRMVQILDAAINRVAKEVIDSYNNHGEPKIACGRVTLTIDIKKHPEFDGHYEHTYRVGVKLPEYPGAACLAAEEHGELVVQVSGSDRESPKQESFLEPIAKNVRQFSDEQ